MSKILQPIAVCKFFQQTRMGPKSQEVVSHLPAFAISQNLGIAPNNNAPKEYANIPA